jgi:protein-L-isoaspartate(D-aspartate) O-methyltransferase
MREVSQSPLTLRSAIDIRAAHEGGSVTQPPSTTDEAQADELRAAMVDRIAALHERLGLFLDVDIRRALLTVPRHLFAEDDADLEAAYQDQNAIVTKRNQRGLALSSLSAPWLQALMIRQAAVQPGMRVLEIGSGGYNAALLREVVGDNGQVVTVDIDPEVTDRATRCLTAAGYRDVEVINSDAEYPLTPAREFDAIIVTVGAWDIPPAWSAQLAPEGRLVVPLRTHGITRSWALEHQHQRDHQHAALVSVDQLMCGFVPMQGAGAFRRAYVPLLPDDMVGLWQDEDDDTDLAELTGVLSQPRAEAWSGVTISPLTSLADLDLWLATTMPGSCLITARQQAIDEGTVSLSWPHGTPALAAGPNLAYRAKPRPLDGPDHQHEFGVVAHGPDAEGVAQTMAEHIKAWDEAGRPSAHLTVLPAETSDAGLSVGHVLRKRHTRLVISWQAT